MWQSCFATARDETRALLAASNAIWSENAEEKGWLCVRSGVLCLHAVVIRLGKQPALCYRFFTFVRCVCVRNTHTRTATTTHISHTAGVCCCCSSSFSHQLSGNNKQETKQIYPSGDRISCVCVCVCSAKLVCVCRHAEKAVSKERGVWPFKYG